jgi:transcriptional regulator GlxA family with amidase domain
MARNVLVTLFDDVDALDFCGPLEVFAITGQRATGPVPFTVTTAAERRTPPITTRSGLRVTPYYTFSDAIQADILIVPGGLGARHECSNPAMVEFIQLQAAKAEIVMSVCAGALILGAAGLLDGLNATTHQGAIEDLISLAPNTCVVTGTRFIDSGKIITSAGSSTGIDAALYVVQRLFGPASARETAHHMEYSWAPIEN